MHALAVWLGPGCVSDDSPTVMLKQLKISSYFKGYIQLHDATSVARAITLTTISGMNVHGAYAPMEPLHPLADQPYRLLHPCCQWQ